MWLVAYKVIEDIENYGRIGEVNKEISRLAVQIFGMNEICAPRNKAVTSLLKFRITELQIKRY